MLLIDRATFPRDKCCGEGVMPHGVDELRRLGLLDAVERAGAARFTGIAYQAGPRRAVATFPEGTGRGIRRLRLDALATEAAGATPGLDLRLGVAVRQVRVDRRAVVLETSRGTVRARCLVGADGAGSVVRRHLGLARATRGPHRYGGRVHLRLRDGVALPGRVEVHFEAGHELYVTPVDDGLVNVALLCDRGVAHTLRDDPHARILERIAASASLAPLVEGSEPAGPASFRGPLRQDVRAVVADRALLVGDAAGFLDPITGEGVSIGLVTARLAAEALLEGLETDRLDAGALAPYARRRAEAIRDPLRLTRLVLWWARQPALRGVVVENLARNPASFERMLGVIGGSQTLRSAGLRHLRKVALRY